MKTKLCLAAMLAVLSIIAGPLTAANATCPDGTTDPNYCTPSAPTVVTTAATAITPTGATLNGTVNPQGQATTYHFEYGTTTAYGTSTPGTSLGATDYTDHAATADITGLLPNTTYHVRIVATNADGTTNGQDVTFTTGPAAYGTPPTAVTGPCAAATTTGFTISGQVNPNGAATDYAFQYGTTTAYGNILTKAAAGSGTAPVTEFANLTGLTPATTYHYQIVAGSAAGVAFGVDQTCTTLSATTTKPKPRLTLRAKPHRDKKKPYKYRAHGRLHHKGGVTKANGCNGRVRITIRNRTRKVLVIHTHIHSNCHYSKRFKITRKIIKAHPFIKKHRGKFRIRARFMGNDYLRKASAHHYDVKYGKPKPKHHKKG